MKYTSATCETCIYGMCFETSGTSLWNICNVTLLFYISMCVCLMIMLDNASECWRCFFHMSHIHLYLEKFHEVWNKKVTWNDKSYSCLDCTIKWMRTWDVNQTLQSYPNDSRWTLQQKSRRVHVEQMLRECLNWPKTLVLSFIMMLLWPKWNCRLYSRYEVWPLSKVDD
jgi:hypothetical protein